MRRAALAFALLLAAPVAAHADDGNGGHQATLSLRWEHPNRGLEPWQALRVEVASTPGNWQRAWQVAAETEERFGRTDHAFQFGATLPLDARWLLQAEAGIAPDADFLPRRFADLRVARRFEKGYLATAGVRSSHYRDQRADRALLSLERYAGAWRLAWTANLTRVDGHHAPGQDLAIDRYSGDRDSIGLRLWQGKELVALPDGSRRFAGVRSAALAGRHWIRPRLGVQWMAGYADQDGLYDRPWLQIGLMHAW